jgi:hypothetical protein
LSLSFLIILIIINAGCINDENNYKPDVSISNVSDFDVNATVIIINDENEIFNESIFLKANSYSQELLRIKVPGSYHFKIFTDNNISFEKEESYSNSVSRVAISIENDEVKIHIKVT